jgi:hypothetical protein
MTGKEWGTRAGCEAKVEGCSVERNWRERKAAGNRVARGENEVDSERELDDWSHCGWSVRVNFQP